ncbi:tRNA pseudouridine synthase A [hydrothermal vent metagenome]|uniref:tRNA pseudouridine synthase A n=1 Tax=hydrothermal vent metagenome TaxID=652676 RepID=A0A3B1E6N2_9ZZZZ
MKIKITLSYNGAYFQGFAPQLNKKGVLNHLQIAFASLGITSKLAGAGRTDKGVHALSQVVHTDISDVWIDKLERLKIELNRKLQHVSVKNITKTQEEFHARFSAKKRVYRYIISSKKLTPFNQDLLTYVSAKNINIDLITQAIKLYEGEYNFKFFKKSGSCTKTNTRIIYKARFYKHKDYFVFLFIANGFLRNQVRIMVGFLLEISKQKLFFEDLHSQLKCIKLYFKKPAPPQGLYLTRIIY